MGGDPHSILSSAASRPHTVIGRTQPVKARVDDIRLVPAARSEERCPRLEIQSWRSGKAGGPEYRCLRGRRRLGMTSAADIAAPGGTIQRAHELLVLSLSIINWTNADVPPVVAQAFYVVQVVVQV